MRILILLLGLLTPVAVMAEEKSPAKDVNFISPLKKDQKVILHFKDGYYEITIIKDLDVDLVYKITEVGKNYIVVEDMLGIKEIRISVYRIKSITTLKIPKGEK